MSCRLPRKTVTVCAPKKLLSAVLQLCDGSRPWSEVIGTLSEDWEPSSISTFMSSLVQDGLLVEASLLWAHWSDIAQLPVITAVASSPKEIGQLHQVAERKLLSGRGIGTQDVLQGNNKFAELLAKRQSTRTFDDKPITVECLCSILWAAQGVTRANITDSVPWRRTIASGGNMHSVRWFIAILRDLPVEVKHGKTLSAGIYEARFHKLGGASLHQTRDQSNKDANNAWRCLRDPRVLRFASALILPVYDVAVPGKKYGNRATLYAVLEAGQALQNAQLMAFDLGASGMLRGDTIAHESLHMLGLNNGISHWLAVPAMVVGAQATCKQLKQQGLENALKITPNLRLADDSFAFASKFAGFENNSLFAASGRSHSPQLAVTKTEAEAWERLAWASPVDANASKFQVGRFSDVEAAIDPHALVLYSKRQYQKKDFPFLPFSLLQQYLWVNATDVETGLARQVLTDCVYASSALPSRFQKFLFTNTSTSGMAAGISFEDALCRATLELIERDAFLRAWISRSAPPSIKTASMPRTAQLRIKALTQKGFKVVASNISSHGVTVVSVFAQSESLPFTAITASAHFLAEEALNKALDEMEGRIAHAQHFPAPMAHDKNSMRQIERLYRSFRHYKKSDFYVQTDRAISFTGLSTETCQNWHNIKSRFFRDGFNLLAVDMTPQNACIEQGRIPLYVARVLIPGLVPIWFEEVMQPEGMSGFYPPDIGILAKNINRLFIHPFT